MSETRTLPERVAQWAAERPNRKALVEMGPDGAWVSTTWGEYGRAMRDLAKGLIVLGVQPGDGVALIGNNRRDWVISQMGISAAPPFPRRSTSPIRSSRSRTSSSTAARRLRFATIRSSSTSTSPRLDRGLIELDHIITMDAIESERPNGDVAGRCHHARRRGAG